MILKINAQELIKTNVKTSEVYSVLEIKSFKMGNSISKKGENKP